MNATNRPPRPAVRVRRGLFLELFRRRLEGITRPLVALASCCLALTPQHGFALPTGGQLAAGQVTTTVNGAHLTLDQASRAAIMNWRSFDIAPDELVRILQPGADAAMLARVTGGDPTQLLGSLKADGKLFLINPRGILVGQGAMIDTAAFLASTLDVADADFLRGGPLTFKGDSAAGVVNLGRITAREGNVLLLAHTVKNAGEINAPGGTAGLGAGTEVYLATPDTPDFVVKTNLTASTEKTGVDNPGVITAAQARLEAAGGSMFDLAVNQSGAIRATGVEHRPDGRVLLTAGGGNVSVTGTVAARDADGSGGEILVGGDFQGKNSAVANAAKTYIGPDALLDASTGPPPPDSAFQSFSPSAFSSGGRIIVWADDSTRFLGAIEARAGSAGGDGGFAEVSGKRSLQFAGTADLSAPAGKRGELLLDPDDITIVAGTTTVDPDLDADKIWSFGEDTGVAQTLGADTLAGLLLSNSVTLQANDTLTVDSPVTVASGGAASVTLTLQASTLALNQSVSLANVTDGRLHLTHNIAGPGTSLTTASGATLAAGLLRVDGFPVTTLNGPVTADRLVYSNLQPATSLTATNPANDITDLVIVDDEANPQPMDFSGSVSVHSNTALGVAALVGSSNNFTLSSGGDLTLKGAAGIMPATAITSSGTARLASTGGVVINQAGTGLLAGPGRRLFYTSNTGGAFTLGLAGYTQFDGVSYPDDPQGAITFVLYNAAGGGPVLALTITANDFIRLYGETNPTFTASYSGGTAADLTTLPTFSIQGGPAVNVGTYTIVPSGATSGTHTLQYVNGTLTLNPATLTYVANAASRLYGDLNPAFSGTVTGFVNGDTLVGATTGTLAFSSPATVGSTVGSHAINGGGLTANFSNYIFQDAVANLTALSVNKAPLTVAFNNATRTFGAAEPVFGATFSGFRNGDTAASLDGCTPASTANPQSPVGTYVIGAAPTANNYAVTVVPGTLTVTPAPLTLTVNPATFTFSGTLPTPGFTLTGLIGNDAPTVLTGVQFNTAALASLAPGMHLVSPTSLGTAQNYAVTSIVPGLFTVNRRSIIVSGDDANSVAGVIPPLTASRSFTPVAGGPQFTLTATTTATPGSPAGNYLVTPVIVPAPGTSVGELEAYYGFTRIEGTLHLAEPPVSQFIYTQLPPGTTITITSTSEIDIGQIKSQLLDINIEPSEQVRIARLGGPVSPETLGQVALELKSDIMSMFNEMFDASEGKKDAAGNPIRIYHQVEEIPEEQHALFHQLFFGKMTFEQMVARMESDATVRAALLPFITTALTKLIERGGPFSRSMELLTARIANRIETQRKEVAATMQTKHDAWVQRKENSGLYSLGLNTMPDFARSATQEVYARNLEEATDDKAGAYAAGAGGGAVLGGTAVLALHLAPKALPHVWKLVSYAGQAAKWRAVTAAGIGAGSAAVVIGAATFAVTMIVDSVVKLVEEGENKQAFDQVLDRAGQPVSSNLSGLDFKNDKLAQAELMTALAVAMQEIKFTPGD